MCVVNNEVTSMLILTLPEPLANPGPFSTVWYGILIFGTNLICTDDLEFLDLPESKVHIYNCGPVIINKSE